MSVGDWLWNWLDWHLFERHSNRSTQTRSPSIFPSNDADSTLKVNIFENIQVWSKKFRGKPFVQDGFVSTGNLVSDCVMEKHRMAFFKMTFGKKTFTPRRRTASLLANQLINLGSRAKNSKTSLLKTRPFKRRSTSKSWNWFVFFGKILKRKNIELAKKVEDLCGLCGATCGRPGFFSLQLNPNRISNWRISIWKILQKLG